MCLPVLTRGRPKSGNSRTKLQGSSRVLFEPGGPFPSVIHLREQGVTYHSYGRDVRERLAFWWCVYTHKTRRGMAFRKKTEQWVDKIQRRADRDWWQVRECPMLIMTFSFGGKDVYITLYTEQPFLFLVMFDYILRGLMIFACYWKLVFKYKMTALLFCIPKNPPVSHHKSFI